MRRINLCRGQQIAFALLPAALQQVRISDVAQQIGIATVVAEGGEIVVLGPREIALLVGEDRQAMIGNGVVGLDLEDTAIIRLGLIEPVECRLTMAEVEVLRDERLI